MKGIDGRASSVVAASAESCFALLEAIDRYPVWNGAYVRDVEVLDGDGDGQPTRARIRLHVAQSPFGKDFEFDVAVRAEPHTAVYLSRLPNDPSDLDQLDITWHLHQDSGTRIELEFHAAVSFLPSLLPLPGVGDLIADALLERAAAALDSP